MLQSWVSNMAFNWLAHFKIIWNSVCFYLTWFLFDSSYYVLYGTKVIAIDVSVLS